MMFPVPHLRNSHVKKYGSSHGFLIFVIIVASCGKAVLSGRKEDNEGVTTQPRDQKVKTILTWNDYFEVKHFGASLGTAEFQQCKEKNCALWDRLDNDPDLPHDQYDAIVFHGIETGQSSMRDLPLTRSPHQRYIFVLQESVVMRPDIYGFKNFFNWTATHRIDSDIRLAMIDIQKIDGELDDSKVRVWDEVTFWDMSHIPDYVRHKTKLAVWFVSNSNTQSERDVYVDELSKYVDVDIYGWGRELTCRSEDTDCDLMLDTTYKFYLAFENSICDEYVTEKFNRGIRHYVIPIVYGGADYKAYAPPLSYIDVLDFATPQKLAEYLEFLDQNPEEYRKYFWWKKYYVQKGRLMWCEICERLNDPRTANKVYPDMALWWKPPGHCKSPVEYYSKAFYRNIYTVYPEIVPWWIKRETCVLHSGFG